MLNKLKSAIYGKNVAKYSNVDGIYEKYKYQNFNFHKNHKLYSWCYLQRLLNAEKKGIDLTTVKCPKGTSISQEEVIASKDIVISDDQLIKRLPVEKMVDKLLQYDVISFDIFDTLIFRPFEKPTDLFYLLEAKNEIFDFASLRMKAEHIARQKTQKANMEVDVFEIYTELARLCAIDAKQGANDEIALEQEVCYANEYMLEVFNALKKHNKKIVCTSDMYLPSYALSALLNACGYDGYNKIYVSCECEVNKASGLLFEKVKEDNKKSAKIIHIGDNKNSDYYGAISAGIDAYYYQQCCEFGNQYRPRTLISPVSSVYKGIVNNYLYNGTHKNSPVFNFGFIYGGYLVSGFCDWINEFSTNNNIGRIVFLARDMDIFYKAYEKYYKKYPASYAATSRFALQELIIEDYPSEFFHHTIKARCDRGYTIERAFRETNLELLLKYLKNYRIHSKDIITSNILPRVEKLYYEHLKEIVAHFSENENAARLYFKRLLGGAKRVCVADLGWRGSALAYLKYLLEKKWKLCDCVLGVLFGSTISNTSVNLISRGIVTSYAYNHLKNRDFLRNSNYEVEYINLLLIESIFSSQDPSLIEYRSSEKGETEFLTYDSNPNKAIVKELQDGMLAFLECFEGFRTKYNAYYRTSAVDAFEPLFLILGNYDYMSRVLGDVVDTPYAIAGLHISQFKYVPIGKLMFDRQMIKKWPIE